MLVASDTRAEFGSLFSLYEWVMIVTTVIVFATVLFAAVRYRRREGRTPSAKSEANVAEIVYTLILVAVVVVLTTRTFTTENRVDAFGATAEHGAQVIGLKGGGRFPSPASGVTVHGDNER